MMFFVSFARRALFFSPFVPLLAACVMVSCNRAETERAKAFAPPPGEPKYSVTVRRPAKLHSVPVAKSGEMEEELQVACETCHSITEEGRLPQRAAELEEFHVGLQVSHGDLSCRSCHDQEDARSLRLADGRNVPMRDAMDLCGQCHGPQFRDYRRGSHGGMIGYWDLSQGPRVRNNCVSCHDPHTPAFVGMQPVFPPKDRDVIGNDSQEARPRTSSVSASDAKATARLP